MTKVTSIRLSDDLMRRLDELATAVDRPRAWLIEQAIARYIEDEAWQIAAITDALAAYRSGNSTLHPHDEVMEGLAAKLRARAGNADPLA